VGLTTNIAENRPLNGAAWLIQIVTAQNDLRGCYMWLQAGAGITHQT